MQIIIIFLIWVEIIVKIVFTGLGRGSNATNLFLQNLYHWYNSLRFFTKIGDNCAKNGQNGENWAKIGEKWAKIGENWAKKFYRIEARLKFHSLGEEKKKKSCSSELVLAKHLTINLQSKVKKLLLELVLGEHLTINLR